MDARLIPYALIWFRLAAGPAILGLALLLGPSARIAAAVLLALGVLSDVFDGVIARRIGSVTADLRTLDGRVDLVFWISALAGTVVIHPGVWAGLWPFVAILAVMEPVPQVVSFVRFRKEASPHHLLSKLFGLGLWALLSTLMLRGDGGWLTVFVFCLGLASQLEALGIMLALPAWRADVKGLRQALQLRAAAG